MRQIVLLFKRIVAVYVFVVLTSVTAFAGSGKYTKSQIEAGRKIFETNCVPCHGKEGEGVIGSAIGCHGVRNKTDNFLFRTIYNGRKGDHGVDMPSWGIGGGDEASKLRKVLEASKEFTKEKVDSFVNQIYGDDITFFIPQKRGADIVRQLGGLDRTRIGQVIAYIRSLEITQERDVPAECFVKNNRKAVADSGKKLIAGKEIFLLKCAKCHGEYGDGDPFFIGKDLVPRDFTDSVYMNSKTDDYLKDVVRKGGLSQGRSGVMAAVLLSDRALDDVVFYIRSLSR